MTAVMAVFVTTSDTSSNKSGNWDAASQYRATIETAASAAAPDHPPSVAPRTAASIPCVEALRSASACFQTVINSLVEFTIALNASTIC
ncbi:hypothetical protein [Nocardia salmonicida]|uniref:hypothetical protein n=1 Tax=Nocardia salmonicida TaxID=53431 RepID=UPI0033F2E136